MAAAAGIGAAGSIIGGVLGGKGAKKAAKLQRQTALDQIAANNQLRTEITGLYQPTLDRGDRAGGLIGSFLGTEGGDKAAEALAAYRGSTGYQDMLNTGLGAVNSNAYARVMGASGATLKALQTRGAQIADQSSASWLNGLQYLNSAGNAGRGAIAGIGQSTVQANNAANQNAADASSNAALYTAGNWQNAIQGVANSAGSYFGGQQARLGSSYSAPTQYAGSTAYGTNGGFLSRTLR